MSVDETLQRDEILAFDAITNFVKELIKNKPLKSVLLYHRLISKTTLSDIKAIRRHNLAFLSFFNENKLAIEERDHMKLETTNITYSSDRVYINIKQLLETSDSETREVIWKHLLTIYALLDPKSRKHLKSIVEKTENKPPENNNKEEVAIKDMIEQLQTCVSHENQSVEEGLNNALSSGVFMNIVNSLTPSIERKELNIMKMMSIVTSLAQNEN